MLAKCGEVFGEATLSRRAALSREDTRGRPQCPPEMPGEMGLVVEA